MTSNSNSHAVVPKTRRKSIRVTAQHTLERVRNNQRRHRARRRDYIETLEQKLSQAEQSIRTLRDQVKELQAKSSQCRNQDDQSVSGRPVRPQQFQSAEGAKLPSPRKTGFQAFGLLPDTANLGMLTLSTRQIAEGGRSPAKLPSPRKTGFQAFGPLPDTANLGMLTLSTPLPNQLPLSDNFSGGLGPEFVDAISPHTGFEDADDGSPESEISRAVVPLAQSPNYTYETPLPGAPASTGVSGGCRSRPLSASDQTLQTTDYQLIGGAGTLLSTTANPDPIPMTTGGCCSDGHSSKPDDSKTDEHDLILSRENSPLLSGYVFQPAVEAYYTYNTEGESTMLCAEAYLLIAQQNFKRVSQKDVAIWLWHGCRKSLRPGEGCRVKTDVLFNLLAFISDA
ncbi:hypothetical protein V490_00481 [Pseudogymnoascus sp. VKM F-3557]|nr:hypothetical protein V490_00481 [Pseudogymnoascus sp. VKM F-3557]